MNRYFQSFPTIYYPLPDGENYKLATDILRRANFSADTKERNSGLVDYTIKDGDTPDNIAMRFYGSPHYHWVVLMINNMINPYYDWPLSSRDLDAYVERKYGAGWVHNPHHFEILDTGIQVDYNDPLYLENGDLMLIDGGLYDGLSLLINVDTTNYPDQLIAMVSNHQYEFAQNQQKRKIKLLRPEFVSAAASQLQTKLRE